ncbi:MAG: Yip1 family protein [Euryarchaeota archaeon]|nr:Yip1 family protein [Euryarchaeota archaeon]
MFSVKDLLLSPKLFFEELGSEEIGMKIPVLIVAVMGVMSAISAYLISSLTVQLMPPEAASISPYLGIFGLVGGFIGAFVMWLIWGVLLFVISALFKGSGSFGETMAVVAYGFVPQIAGSVISLIIINQWIAGVTVPQVTDPMMIEQVMTGMMNAPMMQLSMVVGILFMLWGANIWVFGISAIRKISLKHALITVGLPVVVYLLFTLSSVPGM